MALDKCSAGLGSQTEQNEISRPSEGRGAGYTRLRREKSVALVIKGTNGSARPAKRPQLALLAKGLHLTQIQLPNKCGESGEVLLTCSLKKRA